jgi:UDP-N-acetylglucosamine transferase subunit ALG13
VSIDGGLPLVFVTVGTDHHPFDRMTRWVDEWLAARTDQPVRCLVQSGTSRPPRMTEYDQYFGYQQMETFLAEATAVVCHGGPGSVMMCRAAGKRPIVVPRRHDLGEHVDDHQLVFARRIAAEGDITLAEDQATFDGALDRALAGEQALDAHEHDDRIGETVAHFERLVDKLMTARS